VAAQTLSLSYGKLQEQLLTRIVDNLGQYQDLLKTGEKDEMLEVMATITARTCHTPKLHVLS
jgi:hypothetical protein